MPASTGSSLAATCCPDRCRAKRSTRLLALDVPVQFIHGNGDREVWRMRGIEPARCPILSRPRSLDAGTASPATTSSARELAADAAAPDRRARRRPVLPRDAAQRHGDLHPPHAGRTRCCRSSTRLGAPLVVCGHTHMQFDRTVGTSRVVNAGSVGMPFGEPGAYWLLLGPDVQLRAALRSRAGGGAHPGDRVSAGGRVRDAQRPPSAHRGRHARRLLLTPN